MTGKPKPTALKLLAGNPGKRELNPAEPMPKPGRPAPLESLSAAAMVHFARYVDQLDAVRVVTVADGPAVSVLAQATADYEEASRVLAIEGKVVAGDKGVMARNPWVIIQKQALDQMQRGFSDFGLTAASRSKIIALPAGSDDDESRFFGT